MEIKAINNLNHVNGDVNGGGSGTAWSFGTNWTVSDGSLETSVVVESSDSPITDDDIDAVNSTLPPPLLLTPPSPDYGPCEIKICFAQKYEIRQVYVRSTARVYEIYYAPYRQGTDEYLCTVRCSIAERDGEVLLSVSDDNVAREHKKVSSTEAKSAGEVNNSTSEDDWVEVKVPESPLYDYGTSSLPNKTGINGACSIQDLYEATAQISDADPCISITIRLLSLQNKSSVYIDEVYVFADPVDSSDLENQEVQIASSTGSALMAMLVPTLMQLSKSSGGQMHEENVSSKSRMEVEVESASVDSTVIARATYQDEKLVVDQEKVKLNNTSPEHTQSELPTYNPAMDRLERTNDKNDLLSTRVEGLLEQLVSRVSRVEDFCSRFEENMLKPINSMEARLQRVEQQLEILTRNSQYSELPPGTKISAPSFPCDESNSSSVYDDASRDPPIVISETEKRDLPSTNLSKLSDELPITESIPHFIPGLVITAPEFSCSEDDEDDDVLESSEGPSLEKPKQPLSIDDALAAALSGFLATSSKFDQEDTLVPTVSGSKFTDKAIYNTEPSAEGLPPILHDLITKENDREGPAKFTQGLTFSAPEFIEEEGDEEDSDSIQSIELMSMEDCNENGTYSDEFVSSEIPSGANVVCGRGTLPTDVASVNSNKQNVMDSSVVVGDPCPSHEEGLNRASVGDSVACAAGGSKGFLETDNSTLDSSLCEFGNEPSMQNETEDNCDTPDSTTESTECVAREAFDRSTLLNRTESSSASIVDLEFPILDVKFASHESCVTGFPLEALLRDGAEVDGTHCLQESLDEVEAADNAYFIDSDDKGEEEHLTDNNLLVELDIDAVDVSSDLHDPSATSNQEIFPSLI